MSKKEERKRKRKREEDVSLFIQFSPHEKSHPHHLSLLDKSSPIPHSIFSLLFSSSILLSISLSFLSIGRRNNEEKKKEDEKKLKREQEYSKL